MVSLSDDKQVDIIAAFNTISRYLDDILNIINTYFDNMVSQKYPAELPLIKANTSDTESKKEGKDQESIQSNPHLTQNTIWKVTKTQENDSYKGASR